MGYAAGVDDDEVGCLARADLLEAGVFEKLSNLLAFVLVDLAPKGDNGKSSHNTI